MWLCRDGGSGFLCLSCIRAVCAVELWDLKDRNVMIIDP